MGRFLAIDHGHKRVGFAISDPLGIIAKPFKTITYKHIDDLCNQINTIINEKEIICVVLGFPKGMKGNNTQQTKHVLEFSKILKTQINIPIIMEDERLSSVSAEKSLIQQRVKTGHNKGRIDETAAAIFLQQYLDRNRS